jgi:hypothetical protein
MKSESTEKKSNIHKPWQKTQERPSEEKPSNDDDDDDDKERQEIVVEDVIDGPEESLDKEIQETRGRGYQRYRTTATGRNKHRPWRDDTTVFDAY